MDTEEPAQRIAELLSGDWDVWAWGAAKLAGAVLVGLVVHALLFRVVAQLVRRTRWRADDVLLQGLRGPIRLTVVLLALQIVLPTIPAFAPDRSSAIRHILHLGTITAIAWLVIAVLRGLERLTKERYDLTVADNLEARRVHTQLDVLARAIYLFVIVVAVGAALMTFPRVRELGTSLLASAGVAGLAIGLAARPVLENLIAGLQIALTQPIRIDDVVIIENEWGRIEEITATYVVVRIWDQRRLIVPFSTFIQQPFQNWTRQSAELLGTIYVYADYTVPVEAVREELRRIVEASEHWDGRVCALQVTGASDRTMELRGLMSAQDSGKAWELRVHAREKLFEFLQREYPDALPRSRVTLGRRCRTPCAKTEQGSTALTPPYSAGNGNG